MADLAANPWRSSQDCLTDVDGYTPNMALQDITHFLLEWPGTQTANAELAERHARFVQIIGGYPSINGRFPLDWPLHTDSIKALRLSLYLDTIAGSDDTSLRSRILDRDLKYRRQSRMNDIPEDEAETLLIEANHECVADLLKGLRLYQEAQSEELENSPQPLTSLEEGLLISLHSLDAEQLVHCWPWNELATEFDLHSRYPAEPIDPEPQGSEIAKKVRDFGADSDEVSEVKEQKAKWAKFKHYKQEETEIGSPVQVRFEYKFIQTWMYKHWLKCWHETPDAEGKDSIGQRLLRGLSTVCELAMSRVRQAIISEYGLGAIIVDGGGRISFTVPEGEADNAKESVQNAFDLMFLIDQKRHLHPYLEHDIQQALQYHLSIGSRSIDSGGKEVRDPDRLTLPDFTVNLGESFVRQCMPPRRIYVYQEGANPDPKINRMITNNCEMCNCSVTDWASLSKHMKEHQYHMCMMHRLLFVIGTNQRIRDSILRRSDTPMGYNLGSQGKSDAENIRRVHSISTLDGNSFGIFFQQPIQANSTLHEFDITRRRSFRFNATWYQALNEAFESTKEFGADRIAAWVCAGDDLVLAQYGSRKASGSKDEDEAGSEEEESEPNTGPDAPMLEFLKKFSESLENYDELQLRLTFAGGLAIRGDGGIRTAFQDSRRHEAIAKHLWKTKVQNLGEDEYIEEDGVLKVFDNTITLSATDLRFGANPKKPRSLIVTEEDEREPMMPASEPKMIEIHASSTCFDTVNYLEYLENNFANN